MLKPRSVLLAAAVLSLPLAVSPALAAPPDRATQEQDGDERRAVQNRSAERVDDNPRHAHDELGGSDHRHLPPTKKNVRLVGQENIWRPGTDRVADVAAYGRYAYLTVRDEEACSDAGVAVMDISNPKKPRQVRFIKATEGSFPGEGADVLKLNTKAFTGRVLVFNNEICDYETGRGGVSLWDVSNPLRPRPLTRNAGDETVGEDPNPALNETHSAFAWQAGERAFVVIVDNYEGTDVDILDITDPRKPRLVSETDLNEFGVMQENVLGESSFLHDMTVKRIRDRYEMLLSYWDGGWVRLDVDDPLEPRVIAHSDFPAQEPFTGLAPSEGNAHQAEYSPNNQWVIGTSEDFSPYRIDPFRITTGANVGDYPAGEFGFTIPVAGPEYGGSIAGPTVYGGLGCPSNDEYGPQEPVPPASTLDAAEGEEKIVVLLRGVCFFSEKVEQAQLAGYDAVLIANSHSGSADGAQPDAVLCGSAGHEFTPTIAGVCIGHRAFHLLFGQEPGYTDEGDAPALGAEGEKVDATATFDGWGHVHLLRRHSMKQVDAYAVKEAKMEKYAQDYGYLSVHEVAVDPRRKGLAYLSYYAAGFRVVRYGGGDLREVGRFIDEGGNDFWGVETHRMPASAKKLAGKTVVLASDRSRGLYVFRYTGG